MTLTRPGPSRRNPVARVGRPDSPGACAGLLIVLTCFGSAAAQDANRAGATAEAIDSSVNISEGLSFRRERFTYVAAERLDPMTPPGASVTDNPMVGGVRLLGIIHHPRARLSLVLLQVVPKGGEEGGDAPTREPPPTGVRLRIGDSIGGTRISEIHPDHVVVETASPEGVNRHVLGMSLGERERGK